MVRGFSYGACIEPPVGYAGWAHDCCPEARELVRIYGPEPVWVFHMLITGYPITLEIDSVSSLRFKRFLKNWSEEKWPR